MLWKEGWAKLVGTYESENTFFNSKIKIFVEGITVEQELCPNRGEQ